MRIYRPKKKDGWLGIVLFAISLVFYGIQQGWFSEFNQSLVENQPGLYRVTQFSDGDTIVINMNGKSERVRFIGVDTPETHKPNSPVECYGPAASAYLKNTIGNQSVRLEADPLSSNRDRYDRLLRYVYLSDGTFLNKQLIAGGYGFYYPYFPFTKSSEFESAQNVAKKDFKGLWGNCSPTPTDGGGYKSNPM